MTSRVRGWLDRPALSAALVAAGTFTVYWVTRRAGNPYVQYERLPEAFLDGRFHLVDPPGYLELAVYGDRAYVIDPPAPVLFLLPFVAVFGLGTDHVVVSVLVGASAVTLFWVAAQRLWASRAFAVAMTVLVAFGTNLWWLASDGGFWSFAHTSAVFFACAAMVEATGARRPWVVGVLVGLAGLSRLPAFLLTPLFVSWCTGGWRPTRKRILDAIPLVSAVGLVAVAYLAYNQARFGTITDLGYYHPQYVDEPWFARGRFDITYIGRHVRAIFLDGPAVIDRFPFLAPRSVGMSLMLTTPAFLYAFRTRLDPPRLAALLTAALVLVPLVTHGATGWSQFGYRYAMDLLPPLAVLTASGMRERVTRPVVAVIALSVVVNLWGVLAFNLFDWVA